MNARWYENGPQSMVLKQAHTGNVLANVCQIVRLWHWQAAGSCGYARTRYAAQRAAREVLRTKDAADAA